MLLVSLTRTREREETGEKFELKITSTFFLGAIGAWKLGLLIMVLTQTSTCNYGSLGFVSPQTQSTLEDGVKSAESLQ